MTINLKAPNRPKALQSYLLTQTNANRVGFLKVEKGSWPAIVFNEGNWSNIEEGNGWYDKGIDIFPVLIDIVVKYEDYKTGYELRNKIRKLIGKFNGALSDDWEGTIAFRQFLAPAYDKETNDIILGGIYLFKQNYDFTEPTPTPTPTPEVLDNDNWQDANNTD